MGESTTWRIAAVTISFLLITTPSTAQLSRNWTRCVNSEGTFSPDVAIAGCTAVIQSGNENQRNLAIAFVNRGIAYYTQNKYNRAIADYNEAIRLDPSDATAFSSRGKAYYMQNNYDLAIADYNEAIRLDPSDATAFISRGKAYYMQNNYDLAIADYNKAIRLDPNFAAAFINRGNAYYMQNKYKRAISDYNKSIRLDPSDTYAFSGRGSAYYMQNKYDLAIADYNEAIRLDPRNAYAFKWRGHAHNANGERELALANYDEAIRLELNPKINFAFPAGFELPGIDSRRGARFALPPIPNEAQLRQCISQSRNRLKEDFYKCVVDQAMPNEYKIGRACLDQNSADNGRALLCTTQRQDLLQAYDKLRSVHRCASRSQDNWAVAQCMGEAVLGEKERYYLGCVTANKGELKTAAVCAIAPELTPEQQIALSCAIASGGQVAPFAACAGGQLLARELDKCWRNGIGTENGCFGDNNEYVNFMNNIDAEAQRIMGEDSAAYQAWKVWKDNVLTPGQNGEVVKFFNNGIKDLREGGLGENNEILKLGSSVSDAIQNFGNSFGL